MNNQPSRYYVGPSNGLITDAKQFSYSCAIDQPVMFSFVYFCHRYSHVGFIDPITLNTKAGLTV